MVEWSESVEHIDKVLTQMNKEVEVIQTVRIKKLTNLGYIKRNNIHNLAMQSKINGIRKT